MGKNEYSHTAGPDELFYVRRMVHDRDREIRGLRKEIEDLKELLKDKRTGTYRVTVSPRGTDLGVSDLKGVTDWKETGHVLCFSDREGGHHVFRSDDVYSYSVEPL